MPKTRIGWTFVNDESSSVFFSPEPLSSLYDSKNNNGGVSICPAVKYFEQRVFIVRSPYTFRIRSTYENNQWVFQPVFPFTEVEEEFLKNLLQFQPENLWRNPKKPIFQLLLPYVFFADDLVQINQLETTQVSNNKNWSVIQGRYNIRDWQRPINWSVEWVDTTKDIIIKRGQPLFQVLFEVGNSESKVELIYQERNKKITKAIKSAQGINKLAHGTFGIIKESGKKKVGNLLNEENSSS